ADVEQTPLWFYQNRAIYDRNHRSVMSLVMPYYDEDARYVGVLWVDYLETRIQNDISALLNNRGLLSGTFKGYTLLLDSEHRILADFNVPSDTDINDVITPLLTQIDAGTSNEAELIRLRRDPVINSAGLVSQTVFPVYGWQFITVLPESEIPGLPLTVITLILSLVIPGLALLAWFIQRNVNQIIVKPVIRLADAAGEIGAGDLRYYIGYRQRNDEIGRLARSMDSMKGSIAHSYEQLADRGRNLENRVVQRTRELEKAHQDAQNIAHELQAVYNESLMVVSESRLSPVLRALAARILSLLDASYCSVWLLNQDRGRIQLVATHHPEAPEKTLIINDDRGIVGQTIRHSDPIIVDDYRTYEHRLEEEVYTRDVPLVRAVCVPLMFSGHPIGAVVAGRGEDDPIFTQEDRRLMTLFANMVSPSIRNAGLMVELEKARHEAESANQVKTRFLASVTHELRTPLNLIINNMDFMRIGAFGDVNPEQVNRLNQTIRSSEHLLYLINDLLDVSKIEAGEMELFVQVGDIYILLEDTLDSIVAYMEGFPEKQKRVALDSQIEEHLPELPMDTRRIRQVLINLLTNAVKFTDEGVITLNVVSTKTGIHFTVSDTGSGIPEDEISKLFAAFERTQQAKERNIEGTGLGLPISKFLVEQHGGELIVKSVEGEGTTFEFTLPFISTEEGYNPTKTDTQILAILHSNIR
ncbi:MAG: ATP-binding protein, partial [Aggregatilineales bacterium]